MLPPLHQNPALDGGIYGWSSCSSTCTAMLIALETANVKRPTGGDVRACTHNADGSLDVRGGTNPSQNVEAAQRCFGVVLDYRLMAFEDVWAQGKSADVAFSISISYAVISGTRFDGSPGFRGLHQVVYSGGQVYDPLADGRRAGIPTSPDVWPKDLLRRAAGKYNSIGEGRAAVIVGKAPAVKPTKQSVAFTPGAIFVYAKDAAVPFRVRMDISKATSAPCSPPFLIRWGSGKKRVVEMTAGFLMGKLVEPGATHVRLVSK